MKRNARVAGSTTSSRRQFLAASAASVPALLLVDAAQGARQGPQGPAHFTPGSSTLVTANLQIFHGPIHVGIIRDGNRALLIDCGDGSVRLALDQLGVNAIDQLLFTHYHRDQLCGHAEFPDSARRIVPAKERSYFEQPMGFWRDDQHLFRVYRTFRPDHRMPVQAMTVDDACKAGDVISYGSANITVLDTPGHTEGSVSYLVEVDGRRVVFCGDLLAGPGQIWDLYSLQKGFARNGQSIGGYHGFMGDRWQLADSLATVKKCQPDMIVPSHGAPIHEPGQAIDLLVERLEASYENYVSISALRHYFPKLFEEYAGQPGQMPIRPGIEPPACLRHFGTTWMLVSETGAALVMDVGSKNIVKRIGQMINDGEIKRVEGLWVTHYHFDHTDGIPEFQARFDCPCMTDQRLADVLVRPQAWRLPCLSPVPIEVHQPMRDRHSWVWHEFKLTSYFYPGQTLYHAALLAEHGDLRMLFVGDSHTPAGLDDYCAYNRNLLGRDVGFHYCLSLIEELRPTHLFNCHVDKAFTFTTEEIGFMRKQLDRREELFGQLTPWPHANFATDPSWVRVAPYRQQLQAGQACSLEVVVTNHSSSRITYACRAAIPRQWRGGASEWASRQLPGKAERGIKLSLNVPSSAAAARYVIPLDIRLGETRLPSFAECIVDIV